MSARILVVDDEPSVTDLLAYNLRKAHYDVLTAADGREALRLASEANADLILLDLMLPEIDGLDVCRELRKLSTPWVLPILMLTAMAQPVDQLRGFAHGADAYLTKPFDSNELLKTVAMLLGDPVIASAEEEEDTHDVNG